MGQVAPTRPGPCEDRDVDVGRKDGVPALGIELLKDHSHGVGLASNRAARTPDSERGPRAEKLREDIPPDFLEAVNLAKELADKGARFAKPSPSDTAPKLTDPFGNVLRFDDQTNHT